MERRGRTSVHLSSPVDTAVILYYVCFFFSLLRALMGKPSVHSDVVYCLSNGAQTYVGVTNDMKRRLRQHNGEIKGGARYTTLNKKRGKLGRWALAFLVTGFEKRSDALKLEWRLHGNVPKSGDAAAAGVSRRNPYRHVAVPEARRARDLQRVLAMKHMTKTATLTAKLNLCVYWSDLSLFQCVTDPTRTTWPVNVSHRYVDRRRV